MMSLRPNRIRTSPQDHKAMAFRNTWCVVELMFWHPHQCKHDPRAQDSPIAKPMADVFWQQPLLPATKTGSRRTCPLRLLTKKKCTVWATGLSNKERLGDKLRQTSLGKNRNAHLEHKHGIGHFDLYFRTWDFDTPVHVMYKTNRTDAPPHNTYCCGWMD